VGDNPDINPYWVLMFDGNTNVVNGRVWPNLNVQRRQYRLRILNAGNQRFYNLFFSNGMSFTHIGTDGGFREQPVEIDQILLGVTERADLLVDFSQFAPGTKIVMMNNAQLSPPIGEFPDPETDGRVMQFTVVDSPVVPPNPLPAQLNTIAELTPNRPERILIQNTQNDDMGRIIQAQLDGQLFHDFTSELPTVGATEDWVFVNTTPLDHNKHVHLIQFQLIERVPIDAPRYLADWLAANGDPPFDHPTIKLPYEPYLTGPPEVLTPDEAGRPWKDTIRTPAGMITRIRIRWAPQLPTGGGAPGINDFPFDPTNGVGYIWHCHLLEHEDNEMMRPMTVVDLWSPRTRYGVGRLINPGPVVNVVDHEGINYSSRVRHVSRAGQPPPTRFDLWERVNNENGDWAVQIIYEVGHRAVFEGSVYRALQRHQAVPGTEPPVSPTLWELVL
jgi:FtsP/CotA-like multicopper oxidase with cupredoxin domain